MSRIRRHWLPWLVVVVVLVGSLGSNARADTRGPALIGALLALVAILPVLLQRPRGWMLAVSGLCAGAYFTAGYAEGPVFMAVPVVTFAVALSLPRSAGRHRLPPGGGVRLVGVRLEDPGGSGPDG
ncbi:hypothetical protein, partial [Nocardioides sp. NPDC000441]|uniref:hypothetical protein n=1 Tax=Nocardioides sp. NPDC000441 TaxID=3154256 RepID=UPI003330F96D